VDKAAPQLLAMSDDTEAAAPAPRIGADTEAILKSLGLDEQSVGELRRNGVQMDLRRK